MKHTFFVMVAGLTLTAGLQAHAQQSSSIQLPSDTGSTKIKIEAPEAAPNPIPLVKVRPALGLNVSQLNSVRGFRDSNPGAAVSAAANVDIGRGQTVIATGLVFNQYNSEFQVANDSFRNRLRKNYLGLALQGKTYFQPGQMGGFVRYGVLTQYLMNSTGNLASGPEKLTNDFTSVHAMGVAAIGYAFMRDDRNVMVDLSYNRSVTPVVRGNADAMNEAINLSVGVAL